MLNTAIVGAGPYGLSVAAYLRDSAIPFRIFGRTMDSWLAHMPKGMLLKSDGFASNIYDPNSEFTLERFCAEKNIEYGNTGIPVSLETFSAYGLAFREQMVPEVEQNMVASIDRSGDGFLLRLNNGEALSAKRVILAIGITHFSYIPENLAHLPAEFLSHSFQHRELEGFKGRSVVVIGGGSSATDLAGLLREAGSDVKLVTRRNELRFHSKPTGKPRSLWQQVRHPSSGLGPGLRSRFFADFPSVFHRLPEGLRLEAVRRILGPSGGWFARDKVIGKVPLLLESTPVRAEVRDGKVQLQLRKNDGTETTVQADHVIAATGYKVNLDRLGFLSPQIRSQIRAVEKTPVLSTTFESSVPGLYFAGVAAANSFGPVMRFAFGAGFAARTLRKAVAKSAASERTSVPVRGIATSAD